MIEFETATPMDCFGVSVGIAAGRLAIVPDAAHTYCVNKLFIGGSALPSGEMLPGTHGLYGLKINILTCGAGDA